MTIASYPPELPPPLRDDYSEQTGDGRMMFRPDAGPPTPRRRFGAVVDEIPATVRIKRWQLAVFDKFVLETLKNGSLPFTIPSFMTDGYQILDDNLEPLLDENDVPLLYGETMLVMFAEQGLPNRSSVQADAFRVSFRLLRLPT